MKVLCVFGTRPEAIKMAPVIRALQDEPRPVAVKVCVTGQHREMLDQALGAFGIQSDHDLQLMEADQSLTAITTRVLTHLDPVLAAEKPDWVLVQGDTTTALAAGLAAFYRGIRIGHVEAGLRTGSRRQPFPEEMNRRVVDAFCDLHFAPTVAARANLLREGVSEQSIEVTGNTVIDALQWIVRQPPPLALSAEIPAAARVILVTAHRRESVGEALENICLAVRDIATRYGPDVLVVYPVHRNPRVREPVFRLLRGVPHVMLRDPLDYISLVHLMKRAHLILTDSGGIQEEAPSLGVPVLVLRDVTERPEAVEAGTARMVGTSRATIVAEVGRLLESPTERAAMAQVRNTYGDGHAADRVVKALVRRQGS